MSSFGNRTYKMSELNGNPKTTGLVDLASSDVFNANRTNGDPSCAGRVCAAVCCIMATPLLTACTFLGCKDTAKDTTGILCKATCNAMDYEKYSPKPGYADTLKTGEAYIRTDGSPMELATLGVTLGKEIGLAESLEVILLTIRGASIPSTYALEDNDGKICMIGTYDVISKAQRDLEQIESGGDVDANDTNRKEKLANFYREIGFGKLTTGPTASQKLVTDLEIFTSRGLG